MWFFSFAAVTSLKSEASALADRNFSTKQTLSLEKYNETSSNGYSTVRLLFGVE